MKTRGEIVREWRVAKGLKPADVGKLVGTSRQNIENLEKNEVDFPRYLPRLAKVMGYEKADDLLALKPPPDTPLPTGGPAAPPATTPQQPPELGLALSIVLGAVAALTPGKWDMVRARLGALPGRPELVADVLGDVAPVLGLPGIPTELLAQAGATSNVQVFVPKVEAGQRRGQVRSPEQAERRRLELQVDVDRRRGAWPSKA